MAARLRQFREIMKSLDRLASCLPVRFRGSWGGVGLYFQSAWPHQSKEWDQA
jgi:hypothetical protein